MKSTGETQPEPVNIDIVGFEMWTANLASVF